MVQRLEYQSKTLPNSDFFNPFAHFQTIWVDEVPRTQTLLTISESQLFGFICLSLYFSTAEISLVQNSYPRFLSKDKVLLDLLWVIIHFLQEPVNLLPLKSI